MYLGLQESCMNLKACSVGNSCNSRCLMKRISCDLGSLVYWTLWFWLLACDIYMNLAFGLKEFYLLLEVWPMRILCDSESWHIRIQQVRTLASKNVMWLFNWPVTTWCGFKTLVFIRCDYISKIIACVLISILSFFLGYKSPDF